MRQRLQSGPQPVDRAECRPIGVRLREVSRVRLSSCPHFSVIEYQPSRVRDPAVSDGFVGGENRFAVFQIQSRSIGFGSVSVV